MGNAQIEAVLFSMVLPSHLPLHCLQIMMIIKLMMQVITTVLLVIVAVFIICHSLKCFINLIELIAVLQSETFFLFLSLHL